MLTPGSRLGPYEILAPLGAGGMGEVYRARDSRLNRSVAIKVLTRDAAGDSAMRARFKREAQTIASLSHPNICTLFDVDEQDGIEFLVMEVVEGEGLADRLKKGPLPLDQALRHGIEIAAALETAHRHGVVHRDLKPANIILARAGAKLLDFGIAGLRRRDTPAATHAAREGTALTTGLTEPGLILGTPSYMAPEQLLGKDADTRADLFAFGGVLYEMVTGRRPFEAPTQAAVIGAILEREPPAMSTWQASVPTAVDRIVRKCLAKDPDERWQSAHDVGQALRWALDDVARPEQVGAAVSRRRGRLMMAAALVLAFALGGAIMGISWRVPAAPSPLRLSVVPPEGVAFTPLDSSGAPQFALSPDGSRLVFVGAAAAERRRLWVRSFVSGGAQAMPGTENASSPFWAPDGQTIGFFAQGKLKKVAVSGAPPQDLANLTFDLVSGTWSETGDIVFASSDGLFRISENGGEMSPVTALDPARQETGHRWPQFLSGTRRFIYFIRSERPEHSGVYIGSLDSNDKAQLLVAATHAVFAPPDTLMFEQAGTLMRQRLDPKSGALGGEPVSMPDRVTANPGSAVLSASASANGTLAYWAGRPYHETTLSWYDRSGRPLGHVGAPEPYQGPVLSPDGKRVVLTRQGDQGSISSQALWQVDLSTGLFTRFTFTPGIGYSAVWSPDGQQIIFSLNDKGATKVYRKPSTGGVDEQIVGPAGHFAIFVTDWSHDAGWLLYQATSKTGWDVWAMQLADEKARPLIEGAGNQLQGHVSPDGRWLAYASDESGIWQVYVQPFPDGGGKWQVSGQGGAQPLWRGDGKEMFYVAADGSVMAIPVRDGVTFDFGEPHRLFQARQPGMLAPFRPNYGVTRDGERFLMNELVENEPAAPISVVVNWRSPLAQ